MLVCTFDLDFGSFLFFFFYCGVNKTNKTLSTIESTAPFRVLQTCQLLLFNGKLKKKKKAKEKI